jgi:DNA polymerase-3 subunit epsilon
MGMKFIFIDLETTGIPCPESGLIQLAGAIEFDGEEKESFDIRIRPFPNDAISEEALEVNGVSREDLEGYEDPKVAFRKFVDILGRYVDRYDKLDKFHLVAYNAKFDADHLRAWFEKNGDGFFGSWFWHPPLDVMSLAAIGLMRKRPALENFKLVTVAETLGLQVDEARSHEAMYDIGLTREIFRKLQERVKTK